MGLINTEVEVGLNSRAIKYYEDLGYEIPRYKNKDEKLRVKRGTKITVKVEHLPKGGGVKVKVKCDCCGNEYEIQYNTYNRRNHDGKTYCKNVQTPFCLVEKIILIGILIKLKKKERLDEITKSIEIL